MKEAEAELAKAETEALRYEYMRWDMSACEWDMLVVPALQSHGGGDFKA